MAIEVLNLFFSYGGKFRLAIDNLRIEEGALHVIMGPNASGKSTLARILSGLISGYSGSVFIDSVDLASFGPKKRSRIVSYMHPSMVQDLNIPLFKFVLFGRYAYARALLGMPEKRDRMIADEAIELMELGQKRDMLLSELSDGERQRAFIAKVIAQKTRYTILDEPTASLDISHRKKILSLLLEMKNKSTFIVILHDINEAMKIFENLIALKDGRVAFEWNDRQDFNLKNLEELFTIRLKLCRDAGDVVIYF